MMKNIASLAALSLLLRPSAAHSVSFQIYGPQALGMGGAFTAVARGSLAQHWNPAALAQENNISGLQLPFGGRLEFTGGLLKDVHSLGNIAAKYSDIQTAQRSGGKLDASQMGAFLQVVAALDGLNKPGKGMLIDVGGGANLKIGRFVLSLNNYSSIGGVPFIDTVNIGLGAVSGVSGSGINYTGANTAAPGNATNQQSASAIAASIGSGGFNSLSSVICGSVGCLNAQAGIANVDQFANAVVNAAALSGVSAEQISQTALVISENAPTAIPILASASSGNSYTSNTSNLTLRGASFTEASLGFGSKFILPGLLIGANLKAIQGTVGYFKFEMLKEEATAGKIFSNYDSFAKTTVQPALDLGLHMNFKEALPFLPFRPRVGAVAKNINAPKFNAPDIAVKYGENAIYTLDPQVRVGIALNPFNFWTLAADMDMTENKTHIPGFKSRLFSAGSEINVFNRSWINIPLRVGMMKNTAQAASKIGYTAGLGVNFLHIILDVSGSISTETEKFNDPSGVETQLPANAGVAAQLAFLF